MTVLAKPYIHTDVTFSQAAKSGNTVCGDLVFSERTPEATTVLLCDGLGSGIKAHIAATLCASRMMELMRQGVSPLTSCERLMRTMHLARTEDIPFAAFTLLRVLNDGSATVFSYEMPPPLLIGGSRALLPAQHFFTLGNEVVGQAHCLLRPGDSLLFCSDGITQAGMGVTLRLGWTMEGVHERVNKCLAENMAPNAIPGHVLEEAARHSGGELHDDATACLVTSRLGAPLTVLTGPPLRPSSDRQVVQEFLRLEGAKVICGSTTAEIVSRSLGISIQIQEDTRDYFEPPRYFIDGVDLVTEGAFTLNRVFNLLGEEAGEYEPESSVGRFCRMIREADYVNFRVGQAPNPAANSILFKELGILPRVSLVPLIAEKIRKQGKLVVIDYL